MLTRLCWQADKQDMSARASTHTNAHTHRIMHIQEKSTSKDRRSCFTAKYLQQCTWYCNSLLACCPAMMDQQRLNWGWIDRQTHQFILSGGTKAQSSQAGSAHLLSNLWLSAKTKAIVSPDWDLVELIFDLRCPGCMAESEQRQYFRWI